MSNSPTTTPVVLIIRDGWGENPHAGHDAFNAVKLARTPVADDLNANWPRTLIHTSGDDVGLPPDTMGNSEVGHQNIGAGRIVNQELMRISSAIRAGEFASRDGVRQALDHLKRGGRLHLMGLVSDGKVHSAMDHLLALLDAAAEAEVPADRLFVHVITDGRDTGPHRGLAYVGQVQDRLDAIGRGRIASVIGRYWAMDRDHRWSRTARAYTCMTGRGDGDFTTSSDSAAAILQAHYDQPQVEGQDSDEFVPPVRRVDADGAPIGLIEDGDAVVFFNFRGDRPRQITKAFVYDDAQWAQVQGGGFVRGPRLESLFFVTMCGYEQGLPVSAIVFEKPPKLPGTLGQVVSDAGLTQFRCAETEKFAHVTFFFNDYREEPWPGETREMIASPRDVATYDQKPRMSADGVCDAVLRRLAAADCESLIVVNFANGDMVGHTGKLDATIEAVECVDACVGLLMEATLARGGALVITADHGNAEQMWNPATDSPHTAHTVYDVPVYVVGEGLRDATLREGGRLADVAPTVLALMGRETPEAMTGTSLIG